MSITFRKRPDHTLSVPDEPQEPHLDLHSIDARLQEDGDDDDIPVLIPETNSSVRNTESSATGEPYVATGSPDNPVTPVSAQSPFRRRETKGPVHIPPPPSMASRVSSGHGTPAWQDDIDDDVPVLTPGQHPVSSAPYSPASRDLHPQPGVTAPKTQADPFRRAPMPATASAGVTQAGSLPGASQISATTPAAAFPARTEPVSPSASAHASDTELSTHPAPEDYAPFLRSARGAHDHPSKPELYVWSDDENDAFAQVARADFTLNRIQPTAGRPTFDASLFRAPSRQDALASVVTSTREADQDSEAAMQAEIDALVTELLDESHEYLKRRFLEEIPEIIAKYHRNR